MINTSQRILTREGSIKQIFKEDNFGLISFKLVTFSNKAKINDHCWSPLKSESTEGSGKLIT